MGKVIAVCISEKKGTVKNDVGSCRIIRDYGLENDAHAGSERQVSLLSFESFSEFKKQNEGRVDIVPGVFGENLLVSGYDFKSMPIGTRFRCGDVLLELMQIGKKCHTGCEISKIAGKCIMPVEGVFAKVLEGGVVSNGDEFDVVPAPFRAGIVTASDRSFNGEREDLSGPKIAQILKENGYEVAASELLPDDEDALAEALIKMCDEVRPDVIFTTGGTGLSPRDHMPEATRRIAHRFVPGIAEYMRLKSMEITPNAMLSRGESVIRNSTLIINLPGSPKAVSECLSFILPSLSHGLGILRGDKLDK